ncbi:MAG: lysophospholipid acyltransferase family protein [Phycisphaeraceae bacterium]
MARPSSPITAWAQYLGARLAAMGLTMFDVETNERSAAALGRALYRFDRRHRERACGHIAMAFPQWDEAKVDRVARASFEHFMQLAVEVLHTPRVLHEDPLIDRWLLGIREARGMRIITKWDATQRMIEVLEGGGALGFIADQNAGDKGMFVPFFGKLASTYKSIGLLAMNLEVPVVCGYAHRLGRRYAYEVGSADVIRPEEWADQPDPLFYITARYIRAIETMIRMRPEQYLWMHRRWKSRPRHERQGKPIPRTLRRRLESLPWMDETQLEQLEAARDKPGSPVIMQA